MRYHYLSQSIPESLTSSLPTSNRQNISESENCTQCVTPTQPLNDSYVCEVAPPSSPVSLRVTVGVVLVLIILISVLGNSIVCFIVHQKPPMRSAINLLLANMAMSHIVTSLVCIPLALTTLVAGSWMFGEVMCRVSGFIHSTLVCEAISIDRDLITVRHQDKLTPYRAKRLLIATWVFSMALALPPVIGWGEYQFYQGWPQCVLGQSRSQSDTAYVAVYFTTQFFLPAAVMTPAYQAIMRNVRAQMRRIQSQPQQIAMISGSSLGLRLQHHCATRVHVDVNFKARSFKTILILFLTFLGCWMPYAITLITWNVQGVLADNSLGGTLVLLLSYLNCAANPIIYCWRIRKFRDACLEVVPSSLKAFSSLPRRAKRKVNPSSLYAAPVNVSVST